MMIRDAFALDPGSRARDGVSGMLPREHGLALAGRREAVRRRRQQLLGAGRNSGDHTRPARGGQHTVSEWVEIDDLVRVAKLYAATAVVFCHS